ncbi:MAG TPA: hypothetical protein VM238_23000 [Phycisphaerae bacterium]|nr:hypothetical protein [Phycisphaerae bacterium]
MAMPKDPDKSTLDEPIVPDGPTAAVGPKAAPQDTVDPKEKGAGGRRPYDEVLADLKAIQPRVEELRRALAPFAILPDDATKPDGQVLYALNRGGVAGNITCADIRRAREALGRP